MFLSGEFYGEKQRTDFCFLFTPYIIDVVSNKFNINTAVLMLILSGISYKFSKNNETAY